MTVSWICLSSEYLSLSLWYFFTGANPSDQDQHSKNLSLNNFFPECSLHIICSITVDHTIIFPVLQVHDLNTISICRHPLWDIFKSCRFFSCMVYKSFPHPSTKSGLILILSSSVTTVQQYLVFYLTCIVTLFYAHPLKMCGKSPFLCPAF